MEEKNNTADREISISRLFNAPIDWVWEVWTNPDHIKNWWGQMDLPIPSTRDEDKKLILHAELPILGGHILMATDAPESMGLKVDYGNNIHINLEPETREETKRLYEALSGGGKITMELQDMFWRAYYGSCTDKYGVNWMFNCAEKEA